TRRTNDAAYDFLVDIQRHYRLELAKRHLDSIDALKTYYDALRLAVLDTLTRTTPGGYRDGDARFLMGAIYWRQGNTDAAVEQWRGIPKDDSDTYAFVYTPILRALQRTSDSNDLRAVVDRALNTERSRWRSLSYDRLIKFGYRFD